MKRFGCSLDKTKIVIDAPFSRGLQTTQAISQMQDIISIPLHLIITSANLEATPLGKKISESKVLEVDWKEYFYPIIYFMEERLDPNSFYRPFIEIIVKESSEHPGLFKGDEIEWIKGSHLLSKIFNLRFRMR
jgi:HrpA-like RNA helicase